MSDTDKPDFSKIGKSNVSRSKNQERQIAKLLSDWTGEQFRRRRATGRDHATVAVEMCADVIPVDKPFLFSVEAKTGKGFRFESMLSVPRTCLFTEWWHQTCYDAELISKSLSKTLYPMLFFRPNPQATWVAFSTRALVKLKPSCNVDASVDFGGLCWWPHLRFDVYSWLGPISCDISHGRSKPGVKRAANMVGLLLDPVIICAWKDFAANVDPASALV